MIVYPRHLHIIYNYSDLSLYFSRVHKNSDSKNSDLGPHTPKIQTTKTWTRKLGPLEIRRKNRFTVNLSQSSLATATLVARQDDKLLQLIAVTPIKQ